MDDKRNDQYSRAPEIKDLIALCQSLNNNDAKYILIGGFAMILHGFVRGTKDIDILVDASIDNVKKIKKALSILPDNAISEIQDQELEKYAVIRIADEIVIDLMAKAGGIDFQEAYPDIEYIDIEGTKVPVATKELLIRMKNTVRPSDMMDVEYLKMSIEEDKKRQR